MFYYGSLICVALALGLVAYLQHPLLLGMRELATVLLCVLALLGLISSGFYVGWRRLSLRVVWLLLLLAVTGQAYRIDWQQQRILTATGAEAARLAQVGRHLVIAYDQADDIRELVKRGYIAGIFISTRNVRGKTAQQLRAEIAALQTLRQQAKLPPLLVTVDQEGGAVSRLSPLVPYQPTLSSLLQQHATLAQVEQAAFDYGVRQGQALADLGINTNFSPVIDLKVQAEAHLFDFYSRIAERAISDDPEVVRRVAVAYNHGLYSQGVMPTVKHFPGLGHVVEDTHLGEAHLRLSRAQLEQGDWYPFRTVLQQSPAMLMVGHATVDAIDPHHPASLSPSLIQHIIRQQWGFQGKLITDDMSMGAVYQRGLCNASKQALAAGIDYLLISYDWRKVYPVLACLAKGA